MVFDFEQASLGHGQLPEELNFEVVREGNGETGLFQRSMRCTTKLKNHFREYKFLMLNNRVW